MAKIKIIDSIMGSGKTSFAIRHMNAKPEGPYLYITPYIDEVERVIEACPACDFAQPEEDRSAKKTKADSLLELARDGINIASTHALFRKVGPEVTEEFRLHGYTLILDEVINIIEPVKFDRETVMTLFENGVLKKDDDAKVSRVLPGPQDWVEDLYLNTENGDGKKLQVKRLREWAESNRLVWVNNSMLMWLFPSEAFHAFKEVYNMTYLFQGSYAHAYYTLHGLSDYEMLAVEGSWVEGFHLVPYDESREQTVRRQLKTLVNIHVGTLNSIEKTFTDFSHTWWANRNQKSKREKVMKKALYNWFRNLCGGPASENMWTCFLMNIAGIRGKGFATGHVAHNARATNDYRERANLAYVINRHPKPEIRAYFEHFNFQISASAFALSEMLQWVWRSRIRDGKPINIFIPSSRMRGLLEEWLKGFPEVADANEKIAA